MTPQPGMQLVRAYLLATLAKSGDLNRAAEQAATRLPVTVGPLPAKMESVTHVGSS